MKNIIFVLILTVSSNSYANMDKLKNYGIPCLAGFAAGLLLADKAKDGGAIGAAVCAAISVKTYMDYQNSDLKAVEEFKRELEKSNDEKLKSHNASLELRLIEVESRQTENLEATRQILREVLAERLLNLEDSLKAEMTKKLESGELLPKLENNLKEMMKKEIIKQTESQKEEIIQRAVDATIKEVIAKPIGVPEP